VPPKKLTQEEEYKRLSRWVRQEVENLAKVVQHTIDEFSAWDAQLLLSNALQDQFPNMIEAGQVAKLIAGSTSRIETDRRTMETVPGYKQETWRDREPLL
jgi:hypothetical protein